MIAKRNLWERLKINKFNRIIILVTQDLEEADVLGDRIAIMNYGKITCCGSSLWLKNNFGSGYQITFLRNNQQSLIDYNQNTKKIIKIVKEFVP